MGGVGGGVGMAAPMMGRIVPTESMAMMPPGSQQPTLGVGGGVGGGGPPRMMPLGMNPGGMLMRSINLNQHPTGLPPDFVGHVQSPPAGKMVPYGKAKESV